MRTLQGKLFRYCTIAVCAAVVANGCMLNRTVPAAPGMLVPGQYCPGDTLTASYDFLRYNDGMCTPRAGIPDDCVAAAPTGIMTSNPALFPPTTRVDSYQNSIDFVASGDRVEVSFDFDAGAVFIPPARLLTEVLDHTRVATRFVDNLETALPHMGNCARGFVPPTYMPVMVPRTSPSLGLTSICNPTSNGVTVNLMVSTDTPGESFSTTLTPGNCLNPTGPGVPAFVSRGTLISAAPLGLMCGPGGDGSTSPQPIAPPLSTSVRQACR